jgi:hypothetical protein
MVNISGQDYDVRKFLNDEQPYADFLVMVACPKSVTSEFLGTHRTTSARSIRLLLPLPQVVCWAITLSLVPWVGGLPVLCLRFGFGITS